MPETQAELSVRQEGDIRLVEFQTRKILDDLQIQQIGERLSELAKSGPGVKLLLDFSHVEHLSSAALSVLINLNRQVSEAGGRLVLANIHQPILEVFKITRLNKLFDIRNTTQEAMKALS